MHGLNEDSISAWTDPETGILWLRDLLPKSIRIARISTYGYDASASSFYGIGAAQALQGHAHSLIASLEADRSLEGYSRRPIVFICHGLGGVLVKKALAWSSTRTSAYVSHQYDIFVSTFAILFFGTPHDRTDRSQWLALESADNLEYHEIAEGKSRTHAVSDEEDSRSLQIATDHFVPLMKQFRVFFFWEQLETEFGTQSRRIVEVFSAAPELYDTERSGIHATHSGMVKFSAANSSSYRTVLEALNRYCQEAPEIIAHRWKRAIRAIAQTRSEEAFELAGLELDIRLDHPNSRKISTAEAPRNQHFYPPQEAATDFVGREELFDALERALFTRESVDWTVNPRQQKRFIVYGMGGSGKTQFCSKFARDYRER